jgi:hypothetical protein
LSNHKGRLRLDLAYLFVGLHDFLNSVKGQLGLLFHFAIIIIIAENLMSEGSLIAQPPLLATGDNNIQLIDTSANPIPMVGGLNPLLTAGLPPLVAPMAPPLTIIIGPSSLTNKG